MRNINDAIKIDNQVICENVEDLMFKSRDRVAQNMLSYFRNLVEHIAIKIYLEAYPEKRLDRGTTKEAIEYLKSKEEYYFIRKFHKFLQDSRSHYTPDNDGAERLVLKYYEYLLQIKSFMKDKYNIELLHNIYEFPTDLDETLQEYYKKIVDKIDIPRYIGDFEKGSDRFYIQKIKAFFVNGKVYYENTLIPASDESSKFNRLVVFSEKKITSTYAIKIGVEEDIIEIKGKFMPIKILVDWSTSIRPCELKNFAKLFNLDIEVKSNISEYIRLMNYLSKTGLNLVEILETSDSFYERFKATITINAKTIILCPMFDEARKWVKDNKKGSNTVRYLLYSLNNKIIKQQLSGEENYRIRGLYTDIKTLPFEEMPFNSSLIKHNPSIYDLLACIDSNGHDDELLARKIKVNADSYGKLYTDKDELTEFHNIDELIGKYNRKLYRSHNHRRLEKIGNNIFIKGYEDDTFAIIQKINELTRCGIDNYTESMEEWLRCNPNTVDCEEKRRILKIMFEQSKIAMIYGAAGTGKSTLINHISMFWNDSSKIYLANTNPAVENLRRKVQAGNAQFMTIKKYLNPYRSFKADILFIDECSMVNNRDMVGILEKGEFELLVLVGDVYQIEAIQFGNWFNLARSFVPKYAQYELKNPYRTKNKELLELWGKVRNYKDDIAECLVGNGYTSILDESIFELAAEDEIVLCLNYDGLYGINNINRFLQKANTNRGVSLGVWTYKIGDPILFNESSIYENILYNVSA